MDEIDGWLQVIDAGKIDNALQNAIADKIITVLKQKSESLSAWDKSLLARAITELSINVNSMYQPTDVGLRRCLIALREAISPESQIGNSYVSGNDSIDLISYANLLLTVEKIKDQIL